MKLSQLKTILPQMESLSFRLENGVAVPAHFHVTEVGMLHKHFIDCGGKIRTEKKVAFQLWTAHDFEHRLAAQKLLDIIRLSETKLGLEDAEIEVEYQGKSIEKFGLDFDGKDFVLLFTKTACLDENSCGIPQKKPKIRLSQLQNSCCSPQDNCC